METNKRSAAGALKKMQVFYVLMLIVTCAGLLSYVGYEHYRHQIKTEAELLGAANKQTKIAAEEFFDKLEDASVALLSNEDIIGFDADAPDADEFEISQKLGQINKSVTVLSLMDNYCDFAIVYRNSTCAGRLSDGSKELISGDKELYDAMRDLLGDAKTLWITGIGGDLSKIFYIRAASENSCFLGSFYSQELADILVTGKAPKNTDLYLLDNNGSCVIATGKVAYNEKDIAEDGSYTVLEYERIQAAESLHTGWKVVSVRRMKETIDIYRFMAVEVAAVLIIVIAMLSVFNILTARNSDLFSSDQLAVSPSIDALTGLSNAEEAEDLIADKIETCISGSTIMLAVVRITNLDEIRENYGKSGYNGAIVKYSHILSSFFGAEKEGSKNIVGKTGENEFVVFADFTEYDLFKAHDRLKESLEELDNTLKNSFLDHEGDVVCVVGAAIYPDSSTDYDELYDIAVQSLLEADQSGKSYVLHKAGKGGS